MDVHQLSPYPPSSPVEDSVVLPAALSKNDWSEDSSAYSTDDGKSEYGDDLAAPLPAPANKRKRKHRVNAASRAAHNERRGVKRQREAQMLGPTSIHPSTFRDLPSPLITELRAVPAMPVTSTGFTAQRLGSLKEKQIWKLDELEKDGKEVFRWDRWCVFLPPLHIVPY